MCENYNANSLIYHASKKLIIVVCRMARKLKDKKKHWYAGSNIQFVYANSQMSRIDEGFVCLFYSTTQKPPAITDKRKC